jgi:hypothetical protein
VGAPDHQRAAVGLILDAIGRSSLKNKLSATRVERQARHIWRFVGATDKTGAIFGTFYMLTSAPWLQFSPLSDERQ